MYMGIKYNIRHKDLIYANELYWIGYKQRELLRRKLSSNPKTRPKMSSPFDSMNNVIWDRIKLSVNLITHQNNIGDRMLLQ